MSSRAGDARSEGRNEDGEGNDENSARKEGEKITEEIDRDEEKDIKRYLSIPLSDFKCLLTCQLSLRYNLPTRY